VFTLRTRVIFLFIFLFISLLSFSERRGERRETFCLVWCTLPVFDKDKRQ
jgi:hypothetical protein